MSVLVYRYALIFADSAFCANRGGGLINEVKIHVQELGVKEGRGLIFGRIQYTKIT